MTTSFLKLLSLIVLCTMWSSDAGAADSKHPVQPWHRKLDGKCIECHVQAKPKVATEFKCAACHKSAAEMAAQTANLGIRNPHTSIHFGTALDCVECHKEHKEPYNQCTEACHRTWPNTIPKRQ